MKQSLSTWVILAGVLVAACDGDSPGETDTVATTPSSDDVPSAEPDVNPASGGASGNGGGSRGGDTDVTPPAGGTNGTPDGAGGSGMTVAQGGGSGATASGGATGSSGSGDAESDAFEHPGLLLTSVDIERIRAAVGAEQEPYWSGYNRLLQESRASLDYQPRPFAVVTRNTGAVGEGNTELRDDANAAFFHAVLWVVSQDRAHAAKSVEILDAWSSTLTTIEGDADRFLAAGLYGYQFANAAELLRYSDSGWAPENVERLERMLLDIFYPLNHEFLETHAGSRVDHHFANWDASQMVTITSIGVFADDRLKYDEAIDYFMNGEGNGNITRAVFDGGTGQLQESGRDQAHAQLGIGLLAAMCQTAFNQGDDLFAYDDNRLLKGFEYTAQYLLGYDVPFTTYMDQSRTHTEISSAQREQRRPIYEMIYNHYQVRQGIPAPYAEQLATEIRPEGYHGDHPGFGTLLFTR